MGEANRETTNVETWWWLSMSGDDGFIGGLHICGDTFAEALANAKALGLCPADCEVKGVALPNTTKSDIEGGPFQTFTLYTKQEIERLDEAIRWEDAFPEGEK